MPRKHITREIRFDAHTMRSPRDIRCRGPVLNLGDAPQQWVIYVVVITADDSGEQTHHHFTFKPSRRVRLAALHAVIADELSATTYDRDRVIGIPVRAVIL